MPPRINPALCDQCGICQDVCPGDILYVDRGIEEIVRYADECSHCDVCRVECPQGAIVIEFPWSMLQHPIAMTAESIVDDA